MMQLSVLWADLQHQMNLRVIEVEGTKSKKKDNRGEMIFPSSITRTTKQMKFDKSPLKMTTSKMSAWNMD